MRAAAGPGPSSTLAAFGCAVVALGISGAHAADVTYERLLNPEPQNWLDESP